jgi:EAL domain-containing protein (putative c-di-GMP-specific phosphodiesterase class I)/GGDEF domain-containing protein
MVKAIMGDRLEILMQQFRAFGSDRPQEAMSAEPDFLAAGLGGAGALRCLVQPIVSLPDATVVGHEALVRGPEGSPLEMPDALFAAARKAGATIPLELACVRRAVEHWLAAGNRDKLFLNLSAGAMFHLLSGGEFEWLLARLATGGRTGASLVLELTEHERVADFSALRKALEVARLNGVQLALDDFGDGRSSLRLWSELGPDFVKIDKYFCRHISQDSTRLHTLRALQHIAGTLGGQLVAEGIESAGDLLVLRDLGIRFGQGYALGRPGAAFLSELPEPARTELHSRRVSVLPEMRYAAGRQLTAARFLVQAPAVGLDTTHDELYQLFANSPGQQAVAIVDRQQPIALVERQQFIGDYARPYFKELYGRRSCLLSGRRDPLVVDLHAGIEQLAERFLANEARSIGEGFIITEDGHYRGLGTGQALVRAVTELRIEAARYANPLTFLPGNIPIHQHMTRVLEARVPFAVAHADLDHFKPFNDHYGHWRGDEMIRLAAEVIGNHADPGLDFVGHIGGDDFLLVFQSDDWRERCAAIVDEFCGRAIALYDDTDREAGGIRGVDRSGSHRYFPITALSIGIVRVAEPAGLAPDQLAGLANAAKSRAKQLRCGLHVQEAGAR